MTLLEVFVPTYNRPVELNQCLRSLLNSLSFVDVQKRRYIGITINDNSTLHFSEYADIIAKYNHQEITSDLAYFRYRRSGFNIGAVNNILAGFLWSESEYIWCLPDDDISRYDSLAILLETLDKYSPSFLSGGNIVKSVIDYSSNEIGENKQARNIVHAVTLDRTRVSEFLSSNVVQLQEYVYRVELLKDFLSRESSISLINEMLPGLFGLVCLTHNRPYVQLHRSIGIFRDNDPKSSWRHLWPRFSLIDWPVLSEKLWKEGYISAAELLESVCVFRDNLTSLSRRPDILLGLNRRRKMNPFLLLRYHGLSYIKAIASMPCAILVAILAKSKTNSLPIQSLASKK